MSQDYAKSVSEQSEQPSVRPVVAWLTDFGLADGYVGVMKGVALSIAPAIRLVDITHEIGPQNVIAGAWVLATSYRYFPRGTIFVCVVDPGVGSVRRAVAIHAGDWFFVGPDNGLFSYVLNEQTIHAAVLLSNPAYHLLQVSSTFHGRDVFSPVAAHIARGVPLAEVGATIDPTTLVRLNLEPPQRQGEHIVAHIVHIDHFGNLITSIPLTLAPDLFSSSAVELTFPPHNSKITRRSRFFAGGAGDEQSAQPFIYGDSAGYVAVAVRNGSAAGLLGIDQGATCVLRIME
ncbi:MAG TPA: SAM-dependent chlorinase/fluorinase [Ktedonosporobacter sp.]|jgi:S-adenosylmethionine hydrolase|nr:SAM-dependent chlorinase/fluorinase [Ktedonosporobacter sp.]